MSITAETTRTDCVQNLFISEQRMEIVSRAERAHWTD